MHLLGELAHKTWLRLEILLNDLDENDKERQAFIDDTRQFFDERLSTYEQRRHQLESRLNTLLEQIHQLCDELQQPRTLDDHSQMALSERERYFLAQIEQLKAKIFERDKELIKLREDIQNKAAFIGMIQIKTEQVRTDVDTFTRGVQSDTESAAVQSVRRSDETEGDMCHISREIIGWDQKGSSSSAGPCSMDSRMSSIVRHRHANTSDKRDILSLKTNDSQPLALHSDQIDKWSSFDSIWFEQTSANVERRPHSPYRSNSFAWPWRSRGTFIDHSIVHLGQRWESTIVVNQISTVDGPFPAFPSTCWARTCARDTSGWSCSSSSRARSKWTFATSRFTARISGSASTSTLSMLLGKLSSSIDQPVESRWDSSNVRRSDGIHASTGARETHTSLGSIGRSTWSADHSEDCHEWWRLSSHERWNQSTRDLRRIYSTSPDEDSKARMVQTTNGGVRETCCRSSAATRKLDTIASRRTIP